MRHYKKGRKLGTDASHTKAMKKSLVCALFLNDRIKTTETRAKEIRPEVDRVIGWAKKGDVHSRRLAIAALGDKELVREIFDKVEQGMFQGREGGYTRIMKLGNRKGDAAPMVIIELVNEGLKLNIPAAAEPLNIEAPVEADEPEAEAEEVVEAEEAPAEEAEAEVAEEAAEEAEPEAEAAEEAPAEEAETEAEPEAAEEAAEPEAEEKAE